MLSRLRTRLGDGWAWRFEVPVAPNDQRAWDAVLTRAATDARVMVEAETRIADIQGLLRKLSSKRNASADVRLVLLVADSRRNREALRLASAVLATEFPMSSREALAAMLRYQAPARDALIKL